MGEGIEATQKARRVGVGGLPPRGKPGPDRIRGLPDIPDATVRWLYANCSAGVAMSREDFGLTPVEGFAHGKPAIALRAGGFLDTVQEGITGTLVAEESAQSLCSVLKTFEATDFYAQEIRSFAGRFSRKRFGEEMRAAVNMIGDSSRPRCY